MLTDSLIAGSQLAACGQGSKDDLFGQTADQTMFFGDRNEAIGLDQAAKRMIPARQHFETDNLAGQQVYLRFEVGNEVSMLEAVADPLLDLAMDDQRSLHAFVEPDRPGRAARFCTVERNVGPAQIVRNLPLARL